MMERMTNYFLEPSPLGGEGRVRGGALRPVVRLHHTVFSKRACPGVHLGANAPPVAASRPSPQPSPTRGQGVRTRALWFATTLVLLLSHLASAGTITATLDADEPVEKVWAVR